MSQAASVLDEILNRINALPSEDKSKVIADAVQATSKMRWVPNPGPQTEAYDSLADVLLYGGQAGGGKTHLELGWGVNESESGIIFRRERTQTDGLEKEGKVIISKTASFNGQDLEWTWSDGKTLKLAGMKDADSWMDHAGRERDYMGFDEGGEFLEMQVAQIIAWLRAPPGKRTRVIIGSNPPRSSDGLWLIKWFAPWLDDKFDNPADPGELRWAVYVTRSNESQMIWVAGPGEYEIDGERYTAKSYTFIPASLEDNPFRNTPEYRAQLQSLPEPLRSQLLYGKFAAGLKDQDFQLIPTEWVRMAMSRWTNKAPNGIPMCAMGVDCSGGGADPMIIAPRHDGWYATPIEIPGSQIPIDRAGKYGAGQVISYRRNNAVVVVDMGGGYGGGIFEQLKENAIETIPHKGAEESVRRTKDSQLRFTNKRTEVYWRFREALDPSQPGGSPISLPNDNRILADLTAPTYEITPRGVKLEPKEKVMEKLGRSPNHGDAIVMAWSGGPTYLTDGRMWEQARKDNRPLGRSPVVVVSRNASRRR